MRPLFTARSARFARMAAQARESSPYLGNMYRLCVSLGRATPPAEPLPQGCPQWGPPVAQR